MDQIIDRLQQIASGQDFPSEGAYARNAARRLEECRALLQRLANDEPAPEGHTFQSWAKELLR